MRKDFRNICSGKVRPPFFIMGPPRSGTTLVEQLLNSHSRLAVYHESSYYPIFRADLHRYGDLRHEPNLRRLITHLQEVIRAQWQNPPEMEDFLKVLSAPTFEGVFAAFLHLYARAQGKLRGGDKSPLHYRYLSEILERFPESPVIFLIRDPRDTVFSMMKRFGVSLALGARTWNESLESYSRASRPVHLVRYEELVEKPAESVKAICAFLCEPYEPAMLRFFERIPERLRTSPIHESLLGPVSRHFVGTFRGMSTRDIKRIEAQCASGMQALGYGFTEPVKAPERVVPKASDILNFFLDRRRYFLLRPWLWWQLWYRWKIMLRVRARYLLTLGPWRR
jgi:hypothetical protein